MKKEISITLTYEQSDGGVPVTPTFVPEYVKFACN